jgi:hypothetical protein
MIPGPFGTGKARPSRKITPRSYSRRILMEFKNIQNHDGNNNQDRTYDCASPTQHGLYSSAARVLFQQLRIYSLAFRS